jgi:hypothetical protein
MDKKLSQAIPSGDYDSTGNQGWVSGGIDHGTERFAAEAIRRWWWKMGRRRYKKARERLLTAGGGSNGGRFRSRRTVAGFHSASLSDASIKACHQSR